MSSNVESGTGIAAAQKLTDMVNYQDGSIVSRVILKRESGSITLFAFDEGQGLSEHTSPFDALVQVIEGEAGVTLAGRRIELKSGDIVLLPATQPHAITPGTRFKMVLTMLHA
jgi:quercetin dioxygenase-like cupin family protein